MIPHAYGGDGDVPVTGIDQIPGLLPSNESLAEDVLLSLSGSLEYIAQKFEIREPTDTRFLDFRDSWAHSDNPPGTNGRLKDWHMNEINFFIKDDWQVTPNFTLNLGVRYDLIRVPYLLSASGANFTPGLEGGNQTGWGYTGDFDGLDGRRHGAPGSGYPGRPDRRRLAVSGSGHLGRRPQQLGPCGRFRLVARLFGR